MSDVSRGVFVAEVKTRRVALLHVIDRYVTYELVTHLYRTDSCKEHTIRRVDTHIWIVSGRPDGSLIQSKLRLFRLAFCPSIQSPKEFSLLTSYHVPPNSLCGVER
jgi:hypothetical protein